MKKDKVLTMVRDILVDLLNVKPESVTLAASFKEDLDADSLEIAEVVTEIENQFGLEIADEEAATLTTVGALVDFIAARA